MRWDNIVAIWALLGEIEPIFCSLTIIQKLILFSISIDDIYIDIILNNFLCTIYRSFWPRSAMGRLFITGNSGDNQNSPLFAGTESWSHDLAFLASHVREQD